MAEKLSVPLPRGPEREIGIRELRNAGRVLAELAAAEATGRVTSDGRLVGWLVPANEDERRLEELVAEGRVSRPARPGSLVGRRALPRRADVPSLGESLADLRDAEDR